MKKISWKGEEKDNEIENKKYREDLIQEAHNLTHSCSERKPRENRGDKVILKIQENVPKLKDGSKDSYLKCHKYPQIVNLKMAYMKVYYEISEP